MRCYCLSYPGLSPRESIYSGQLVVQMEKFFEHNPGLSSHVAYSPKSQLQGLQWRLVVGNADEVEELYVWIAVQRLGPRSELGGIWKHESSGEHVTKHQVHQINEQQRTRGQPDDFLPLKRDLIAFECPWAKHHLDKTSETHWFLMIIGLNTKSCVRQSKKKGTGR